MSHCAIQDIKQCKEEIDQVSSVPVLIQYIDVCLWQWRLTSKAYEGWCFSNVVGIGC